MAFSRKVWKTSFGVGSCLTAGSILNFFKGKSETDSGTSVTEHSKSDNTQRKPVTLDELELKMVQIYIRHGARTPLHLIRNIKEATYHKDFLLSTVPYTTFNYKEVNLDGGPRPHSPYEAYYAKKILKGGSNFGKLTVTGQDQMYMIGKALRKHYIDKMKLIDSTYNPEQVQVRSTNINRTIATARCLLAGMFGHLNLNKLPDPPLIYTTNHEEDVLLPRTGNCKVLRQINHAAMIHAIDLPEMKPHILEIKEALGIDSDTFRMNFVDLRDDLVARETHGLLEPEVLKPYRSTIEKNASKIMYYAFCGQHEAERSVAMQLSCGPLFEMILDNIEKTNNNSTKFYLYSCHDSTLVGMLGVLDIYNFIWPPFGSDITFELYENKDKDQFVRVMYNGEEQVVRGCSSGLCAIDEFKAGMKPFAINKNEYTELCASNILEVIAKEMMALEKEEVEDTETSERSDVPAGM